MSQNNSVIPYRRDATPTRIQQGDIYRDVDLVEWTQGEGKEVVTTSRTFPYVVILTQDCDLLQDFNNRSSPTTTKHDKYLHSILLCPAYRTEEFKSGTHLRGLNLVMENWGGDKWKRILGNQSYRHHFLSSYADFQIPDLILDFKHFVTAPRDIVYRASFRAVHLGTIADLYRENLSIRFAQYLSRIALPEIADA